MPGKILIDWLKIFLHFIRFRKRKKDEVLTNIRDIWENGDTSRRFFRHITKHYKHKDEIINDELIGDREWNDLNMDDIFLELDRNVSSPGKQMLYYKMRKYSTKEELKKEYDLCQYFINNESVREDLQKVLYNLYDDENMMLPDLILNDVPYNKVQSKLASICSFLAIACTLAIIIKPVFIIGLTFIMLINFSVRLILIKGKTLYIENIYTLGKMLKTGAKLTDIKEKNIASLDEIRKHKSASKNVLKSIDWLTIDRKNIDILIGSSVLIINAIYLFDFLAFYNSITKVQKYRKELINIFESIGSIDCAISMASYLNQNEKHCFPEFNRENTIDFTNAYHLLLEYPVSNTTKIDGNSVLITGSNMAGKTTFIKTIALNIVLARTLGFCTAEKANIPEIDVHTLINKEDDLTSSKSYYFVEVEEISKFLELGNEKKHLIVIDEIFRGTNTVERIAISRSVLDYLSEHHTVMVTTHDIELQDLLKDKYTMQHFTEQVRDNDIYFDFKLKEGPCSSRNAIKLIELKNYPESIVNNAYDLAKQLSKS